MESVFVVQLSNRLKEVPFTFCLSTRCFKESASTGYLNSQRQSVSIPHAEALRQRESVRVFLLNHHYSVEDEYSMISNVNNSRYINVMCL